MQKLVSIIIPCLNEEKTITKLLEAIVNQTYPKSKLEVIISDGMSSDKTREKIKLFSERNKELKITLIDNFKKTIPTAINLAIKNSNGFYIVRMDAHSIPYPDYIEHCVENLVNNNGDIVGGVWEIHPGKNSLIAKIISIAAANPVAIGDAKYRLNSNAGFVDTVPFGAFKKSLIDEIGLYDESLFSNEDYEFNTRVNNSGKKVWLDPKIKTIYYSRADLKSLIQQYFRYGFWKFKMLSRYPKSIKLRQAFPPLFLILLFVSIFYSVNIFGIFLISYLIILFLASIKPSLALQNLAIIPILPIVILSMHFSWGVGFLWSIFKK